MSKITGGDWKVNTAGSRVYGGEFKIDEYYVYSPDVEKNVAIASYVVDPESGEPSEANALVMAASKELLECLQGFVSCWDSCSDPREWADRARAAIAKATGE